jgi:DNA segregation ATPase FtsK/SpoIIIE-like protein
MANISNRICLATSSQQESINVLGDDSAFRIETIGRGILSINGRFTEFQSFYFKKTKSDSLQQTQAITIKAETVTTTTETKILIAISTPPYFEILI